MRKYPRLLRSILIGLFLLCLPVAAFGAEQVTLQLIWKNQFQFAGYYVAQELGFYEDAGLDVAIKEYEFGTDVTADVVSQKADFGVGRSSLILESMEGQPVYLLSAIFQHSPFMLLAKDREDLQTVVDLKGQRIMVTDDVVGMVSLTAMLTGNGIKSDDYTSLKHTFSVDDLISGKTDAIAAYTSNEPFQMQNRGVDYKILAPRDHGFDFYSDILFTSQQLHQDNPQLVDRFNRASLRGWAYALAHIDEAVDIILKHYNTQNRGQEALRFEADTLKALAYDGNTALGRITRSRVTQIAQVYRLLGFTTKPLKMEGLFYDHEAPVSLDLTPEERAWLNKHHTVRARVGKAPPLHFFDGKFRGLSVDYLNLIAKRAGFKVQYVTDIPWSNALDHIKNHDVVDLLLTAKATPERREAMAFTKDYLLIPWVIFTQKNRSVDTIEALTNKTVSVEHNYVMHKKLAAEYPGIKLLVKQTSKQAIEAVATGQADAYIGNLMTGAYSIQQNNFINLKISAPAPFENHNQAMAIRNDWPELTGIINKTFDSISPKEHTAIRKKWFSLDYGQVVDEPKRIGISPNTPSDTLKPTIVLTPEERAWLAAHPKIVVGGEADWAPFDFVDENGKYVGLADDYLKIIGEKLGIAVEMVTGPSWDELLTMLQNKEIDVLPAIYHSEEREAFVHFTDPYLKLTEFIFTRSDDQNITRMDDLQEKTIVVVKGYTIEAELRSNYPTYRLITAPTIQNALEKLVTGEADAFIGDIISTSYNIKELSLVGIRPAAAVPFGGPSVHMAVRKDWPVLRSLIDKALKAIPEGEHDAIKDQWISFAEEKIEQRGPEVALTAEEQDWIKQHPVVRVHNEKDWPPFNYFEYGRPRGLSIDYMGLVAKNLGIEIEYVSGPSWNDFLEMVQRKELDVILNIVKTEDRQKYLLYTEPYVKNPNVIVSSEKSAYQSIEELFGKVVAFPKGFFYEEVLTKAFSRIKRLPVDDTLASLKAVAFGRADAALGEAAVIRTLINKNMLAGLEISGEVQLGNPDLTNLRLGIRNDWPLLQSALMKAMAAITPQEMSQIREKWLAVDKQPINEKVALLSDAISLSPEERVWLAGHQTIRFTGDPDWLPQEAFTSDGQYIGIVADILDLIEARLGIRFERVPVKTWDEAVRLVESAKVDMLSETTSSERDTMTFTKPHLVFPVVIIAKQGTPSITDPGDLKGRRLAVVKDYGYVTPFRRQFPNLDYVVVESVREGLLKLSAGQVDAFLSAASTASYLMSELGLTNLTIIGTTGLSLDLGFGVRKDAPLLVSILNKALTDLTPEEKVRIRQKWVPAIDTTAPQTAAPVSYQRLMIYGIAVFLTLSLLAWILIRSIRRENIAVSFGSPWFRGLVLAGLSAFVLIVAFLGWYMLERNKTEHLLDVDESLRGLVSISEDRLNLWLEERISYLARLGRDPELVAITQRLLQVKPNKRALLASDALREARFFFQNAEDIFSNIGFFVIDPEHVSIGSMRDANIGTRNLIAEQHPELLQRAYLGEVGFVPPMTSDVALGHSSALDSARKPPTMFFIGPVQDSDGRILAVMTLRVDPWEDFARALKSFESSESRESYAFDRQGVMLSSSRFEDQLRRIGLLAEDQSSALNVEIRDPGGNMVTGYRPRIERLLQPLTQMVSRALALRQQMETAGRQGASSVESNMEGYRDYRGIPVLGAWLWSADLDMGLAVEVDVDEALSHYYQTRMTIFGILGFTLLLSVGAILFVLIIGERTSRALIRARDNLEKKVTERTAELQENQKALESAVERSRLLLDSVGEGIFGVDLEGKVVFINPAACRMLGYESEALIGQEVHAKIHHSHADGSHYHKDDCPMYLTHRDGSAHNIDDEVLWRRNGQPLQVEYTSMPIRKEGQVVGAVVTFMDITERRAMREQLESAKAQLQNILDTSPIGVAFSTRGKIHFANPRFKEMFGVSVGDDSPNLYVNPEDRDALIRELKAKGRVENRDLQMYNGDHQVRDMLITYLSITYDGAEGILGWLLDITDRKIVEKEIKEKYEELNRFRKIAIGRELKMIELKTEINTFLTNGGFAAKYKIHGKES